MANVMCTGLRAKPGDAALVEAVAAKGWDAWRRRAERRAVAAALRVARGNQVEAARLLGVHRNTVGRVMGRKG